MIYQPVCKYEPPIQYRLLTICSSTKWDSFDSCTALTPSAKPTRMNGPANPACTIQCPVNHLVHHIREKRAKRTPIGRKKQNPRALKTPCAINFFSRGLYGIDPNELLLLPLDCVGSARVAEVGFAAPVAVLLGPYPGTVCVRSRLKCPLTTCSTNVAAGSLLLGFVLLREYIMFGAVLLSVCMTAC